MKKIITRAIKSFSLIELIVAIAIIMFLGVTAFLIITQWLDKARDSRQISDVNVIKRALITYNASSTDYPKPGDSIILYDHLGKQIGLQGYLNQQVLGQMGNLVRAVKDPSTDYYYAYTLYNNNKGFEIGTFLRDGSKFTNIYSNLVFANTNTAGDPYVMVYGNPGYCDDSGSAIFPKPLSLYDSANKQFVGKPVLGEGGKVYLNLEYLREEGSDGKCAEKISAPIAGVSSNYSGFNVSQAIADEIKVDNNSINELVEEICTHDGLCNSPDIYRISYNYIVLIYRGTNGSITIVELMLDPVTKKYVKKNPPEVVYPGGGSSPTQGVVYSVHPHKTSNGVDYEVVYGGSTGGIVAYKKSLSSHTPGVHYDFLSPSGGASGSNISIAKGKSGTVAVYSPDGGATYSKPRLLVSPISNPSNIKSIELPFECRMPKIIYLELDVYLIGYIGLDGSFSVSRVRISNNGTLLSESQISNESVMPELDNTDFIQVWDNIYLLKYEDSAGNTKLLTLVEGSEGFTVKGQADLENSALTNFKMTSNGGGYVNITYNILQDGKVRLVFVDVNGDIKLLESSNYENCDSLNVSNLDVGLAYANCSGSNNLNLISQQSLSELSSTSMIKNCVSTTVLVNGHGYTVPALEFNSSITITTTTLNIPNGTFQGQQEFICEMGNTIPTGEEVVVKHICEYGYYKDGLNCTPYNCLADTIKSNNHNYILPQTNNNNYTIGFLTGNISNGIAVYSQDFLCKNGYFNAFGTEYTSITCNDGFVENDGKCVANLCGGTLPTKSKSNGIQSLGSNWIYDSTPGTCTFDCVDGYYYDSGICKSTTCQSQVQNVNTRTYNIPITMHGEDKLVTTDPLPYNNGTVTYSQNFHCDLSTLTLTGTEIKNDPMCNLGYIFNGTTCVFDAKKNCKELYESGVVLSGNYAIDFDGLAGPLAPFTTHCNMDNGGGWTKVTNLTMLNNYGSFESILGLDEESLQKFKFLYNEGKTNLIGGYSRLYHPDKPGGSFTVSGNIDFTETVNYSIANNLSLNVNLVARGRTISTDSDAGRMRLTGYDRAGNNIYYRNSGRQNWSSSRKNYNFDFTNLVNESDFVKMNFTSMCRKSSGGRCSSRADYYMYYNTELPNANFYVR
ncbi:MAG: fibrinogen-like YCDxxxxGGGW domain-containing protein [Candidatus Absconditabacteria bacterium]